MKLAALYDVHGNLPALEAVLAEIKKHEFDQIIVGGDLVLGPMSAECVDLMLSVDIPVHFIRGNCESAILNCKSGQEMKLPVDVIEDVNWTYNQLQPNHIDLIRSWPLTKKLNTTLGSILFCHATPWSEYENFTKHTSSRKIESKFSDIDSEIVVCGHTHMQFDIAIGSKRVVNAGSVGMPFGSRGAYWLSIDEGINMKRTQYDYTYAADRITATNYPHAKEFAKNSILLPPSEEKMLKLLS